MKSHQLFQRAALLGLWLMSFAMSALADNQTEWKRFDIELEVGPVWQAKNDVRIPGDSGTEFSFKELTQSGPFASGRVMFDVNIARRHGLRFIVAPLRVDGSGTFDQPVSFAGATFAPGVSTTGKYKFDTYRLGYRYLFLATRAWRLRAGGTLLVRDAEIKLEQDGVTASDSDVGVVPLINFLAEWLFAGRWRAILDFEGLAGGPGRALDLALKVRYDLTDRWYLGGGYRLLEGGADTDEVYNFSWFNYAIVTVGYQF
jgi:hypothetical protein